jgi:hypothetical protein
MSVPQLAQGSAGVMPHHELERFSGTPPRQRSVPHPRRPNAVTRALPTRFLADMGVLNVARDMALLLDVVPESLPCRSGGQRHAGVAVRAERWSGLDLGQGGCLWAFDEPADVRGQESVQHRQPLPCRRVLRPRVQLLLWL